MTLNPINIRIALNILAAIGTYAAFLLVPFAPKLAELISKWISSLF